MVGLNGVQRFVPYYTNYVIYRPFGLWNLNAQATTQNLLGIPRVLSSQIIIAYKSCVLSPRRDGSGRDRDPPNRKFFGAFSIWRPPVAHRYRELFETFHVGIVKGGELHRTYLGTPMSLVICSPL